MPFVTRLPALTGADPYPDALLALDFVGARRGPQYYKALGVTTADITKIPGWTYTGGASTGSYAAKADGSLQLFAQNVPRITDAGYWAEEARTNLLLNTATLSTQSVTVAAVAHTLSFYGTGTVTLTGVSTAGPLVGTGASNRVSLTFTPTAGTLTLTVSGSVTIAQLEAGSFATSPIPTTSVAVTRAADVGYVSGLVVPSAYTLMSQGTVSAQTTGFPQMFALDNGAATDQSLIYFTSGALFGQVNVSNVAQAIMAMGAASNLTTYSAAMRVAANDFAAVRTAGTVATDASGSVPTTTILRAGRGAGGSEWNGPIRRIVIYPRAFGNAELQAITTAGAY